MSISEEIHPELCRWNLKYPPLFLSLSLRHETFVRMISGPGRLSVNSVVSESAICTWRPLIFRGPICGTHGTRSRPWSKCWQWSHSGDKNSLRCRLHSQAFPSLFPPKTCQFFRANGVQPAAAHTWRPIYPTRHILPAGGTTSEGLVFQWNLTPQWTSRLFLSPPQSCATSHPLDLMVCEVPWTEPGNICFSLVFVNSLDWKQHKTRSSALCANEGED